MKFYLLPLFFVLSSCVSRPVHFEHDLPGPALGKLLPSSARARSETLEQNGLRPLTRSQGTAYARSLFDLLTQDSFWKQHCQLGTDTLSCHLPAHDLYPSAPSSFILHSSLSPAMDHLAHTLSHFERSLVEILGVSYTPRTFDERQRLSLNAARSFYNVLVPYGLQRERFWIHGVGAHTKNMTTDGLLLTIVPFIL